MVFLADSTEILCVLRKVNGTINQIDEEAWQQNESKKAKAMFNHSNKSLTILPLLFSSKGVKLALMAHLNFPN